MADHLGKPIRGCLSYRVNSARPLTGGNSVIPLKHRPLWQNVAPYDRLFQTASPIRGGSLDVNNAEWVVTGVIVTALSLGAAIVLLVIL